MNLELSCRSRLRMEVRGPVRLPLAVTPLGSLVSQPPCLLLPLPLLLPGTKEADGAVSCKAGRPCTLPPGPSWVLLPLPAASPRGHRQGPPWPAWGDPTTCSYWKALPHPDPRPSAPERCSSIRHWPWGSGLSQPRLGSPGEQLGADVGVLQWVGLLLQGHRPHLASLWGGGSGGHTQVWGEAPGAADGGGGRGVEPHSVGRRTPGPHGPALGCKLYQRMCSEPGPPPRRWGGRGRLQQKRPLAVVKTRRKLAEGDSSPPSGNAALIRTKQGCCGKVSNWNGAGPGRGGGGGVPG